MTRKGYVLLLVIFGAVSLAFFAAVMSSLNQGYRSQVIHTKQMQESFQIAYSGYQRILAKIYLKPWEERFFKSTPAAENNISLFSGVYDSYVQNNPSKINQADIFIRVKLKDSSRSYVWRIEHIPGLLDSKYLRSIFFNEIPEEKFPATPSNSTSQTVTDLIQKKGLNKPALDQIRSQLPGLPKVQDVASKIGAPIPVIPSDTILPIDRISADLPSMNIPYTSPPVSTNTLVVNPKPVKAYPTAQEMSETIDQTGKITLRQINFEKERSELLPASIPVLEEIFKLLQAKPTLKIRIEGHCDSTGNSAINIPLSKARADSVFDWLVNRGVLSTRLSTLGLGDTVPIGDNSTLAGMAKNRRVELVEVP
ncbi:MAG: OmpA family protein [Candidatus Riflebacteria bacterium]|nr:OmpA family protein [Candidatus Riflebacteria bacterium]